MTQVQNQITKNIDLRLKHPLSYLIEELLENQFVN